MYVNEKIFNSHPQKTETQKEMDAYLFLEILHTFLKLLNGLRTGSACCENLQKSFAYQQTTNRFLPVAYKGGYGV